MVSDVSVPGASTELPVALLVAQAPRPNEAS